MLRNERPRRFGRRAVVALVTAVALVGIAFGIGGLGASAPAEAATITATCANSTGDAKTIQTAINASKAGDEIVLHGPCLITTTIQLLGGRAYRGDSASTTLTEAAGANLRAVLASDSWVQNWDSTGVPISLRDLTIDANKANNPKSGDGVIIRSWNTDVHDLHIENALGNGLTIAGSSANGTPLNATKKNTQVNGTISGMFIENSGKNGIYGQDAGNAVTDWNLLDNWVAGSGAAAIRLENTAGWVVERNHVYGDGTYGINADRLFGSSVSDNYIEDFGSGANGIRVTLQGDASSTIDGNRVYNFPGKATTYTYLSIAAVNYGTGRVAVTGNTIRGNGSGTGLSYVGGSYPLTVTSTGNDVSGVTTARTAGSGVTLTGGY